MNAYTIENNSSLNNLKQVELASEFYALASNSVDKLALGGEENKVDIHTISTSDSISLETLSKPYLAMQFSSKVHKVQWVGGRYVIGYSENDNEVQIYNSENERVNKYLLEAAARNGALDPLGQFFAVSACDGQVYIFKVPEDDSESRIGELI